MAGPSVVVRVLGDLKGLGASLGNASKSAESASSKIHGAFSTVLGQLNSSGVLGPFGESLATIDEAFTKITEHGKDVGKAMIGVGGALAGVGLGLQAMGSKDQAAHQQLQAAVEATGKSYDDYSEQVEAAIKKQEKFGNTANQTQDALRVLTQATNDPAKALQLLGTASDLAAAKHEDLTSAATQLGKTYNGSAKLLKEFGVVAGTSVKAATTQLATATKQASAADASAATARQRLADLTARLAGGNHAAAVSTAGVTAAQDQLAAAQRRLSELEAEDAGKKKLTIAQQFALRDAHLAVTRATGGVATAQAKLSAAEQAATAKTKLSVAQQQELRNAQQRVTSTSAAAVAAHKKLQAAQTLAGQAAHTQSNEMGALSDKLKGQAASAADTFTGHLDALKAKFEDSAATIGQKYGPAITASGAALSVLGTITTTATAVVQKATEARKAATVAEEAGTVAEDASLGPILLIIAAVAALGVAVFLIWKNWRTIWAAMKDAVNAVWTWIKANWPLLLAIILGPIATAAYEIYKHWAQIRQGAADVITWLRTTWQTVTGYITAPFTAAFGAVERGWNDLVGFIAGLPGRISGIASSMWGGILGAFRGMINGIIDIWNKLHFQTPSFKLPFPPHTSFPSVSIGVPHIPHLAEGGLITADGLIYAHAGEAITPAGRTGPAVVVQNASFSSGVDIDLFMRKAAWVAQTARI